MTAKTRRTSMVLHNPYLSLHVFHSPEEGGGEAVNSVVIETAQSLVLLDLPLLYPVALEIKDFCRTLAKPIRKIVISHGHPDHWFGLDAFRDAPSFAAAGAIAEIAQFGESYLGFKQSELSADLLPPAVAVPQTEMDAGEEEIDGVKFAWYRLQRAEYADGLYLVLPQHRVLVAADLIYNGVHLYLGQKDAQGLTGHGWADALRALAPSDYDTVVPGHGPVGDARLIDDCIRYIDTAMPYLEADGATPEAYKAAVMAAFPSYRVDELVGLTGYFAFMSQA